MFFVICSVAVTAGIFVAALNTKKGNNIVRGMRYDLLLQLMGFTAMVDDFLRRNHNKLGELPVKTGQVAVVTGGARGIGVEVVRILVKCGMRVVMGVRKTEAGIKLGQELKKEGLSGSVDVFELDVSSLKSVEAFSCKVSKEYPKIDLLVNNAGIMFGDYKLTVDGFESQLMTNYLGHFYLTHMLLPNLKAAGEASERSARIVNVSSCAHYPGKIFFREEKLQLKERYHPGAAYSQSKLAQLMSTRHIERILSSQEAKVHCYSVHPGIVNTDLFLDTPINKYAPWMMNAFFKTPRQGAVSILYTCLSPKLELRGGLYVSNCRQGLSNAFSKDEDKQKKLFEVTCDMLKVKEFGKPPAVYA